MSIQNPLDARDDRYLKLVLGRMYGQDDDAIVRSLEDFDSPQDLYKRISEDGHPICPECGTTYVDETHCGPKTKKGAHEKSSPRARSLGPIKELPPPDNATELFRERLEALLKDVELLEHLHEYLRGDYFVRENVGTTSVWVSRESSPREVWEAVCEQYGYDPDHEDLKGLWDTNVHTKSPGGVAKSPSETLVTLIGVYALAGGRMDLLVDALHLDSSTVTPEIWEKIRLCVEGSRGDHDKRDGLQVIASQLAAWVRGGAVGPGRPAERSEMDHGAARRIRRYRKQGLTDEQIAKILSHPLLPYKKEDGTSYTPKDVAELGDLNLS